VFALRQQLAHLQDVTRRAMQEKEQLLQQQRAGLLPQQPSPGGGRCVYCAHREQRETAIVTKERQQAAEVVQSAVTGLTQERDRLLEQVGIL
jgi:hypothetical protein